MYIFEMYKNLYQIFPPRISVARTKHGKIAAIWEQASPRLQIAVTDYFQALNSYELVVFGSKQL